MKFLALQLIRGCLIVAALASTGLSPIHAAWQSPLSEEDQTSLGAQAITQHQIHTRSGTKANTVTSENNTVLDVVVLMVELQEKKKRNQNGARLAEVFLFDYSTNNTSVQLINADTFELISVRPINDIHLPLSSLEIERATQVLFNDEPLLNELKEEYIKVFGHSLTAFEQLDMKVSIWEPGPADSSASICNQTRCALVSIFTHEHFNFSIEPVVELKSATVHLDLIE